MTVEIRPRAGDHQCNLSCPRPRGCPINALHDCILNVLDFDFTHENVLNPRIYRITTEVLPTCSIPIVRTRPVHYIKTRNRPLSLPMTHPSAGVRDYEITLVEEVEVLLLTAGVTLVSLEITLVGVVRLVTRL